LADKKKRQREQREKRGRALEGVYKVNKALLATFFSLAE